MVHNGTIYPFAGTDDRQDDIPKNMHYKNVNIYI